MAIDGQLLADGGEAFYRALRIFGGAGDYGHSDLRTDIVGTFKTVAIDIARCDGEPRGDALTAIDSMFYLDLGGAGAINSSLAADRNVGEHALNHLIELTRMASATSFGAQPMIDAAAKLFSASLVITGAGATGRARFAVLMAKLEAVAPAAIDDSSPAPHTEDAVTAIEPMTAPTPSSLVAVDCPARLHTGETCYAASWVSLYQVRNVVSGVNYRGLSGRVRITKGLSYRAGSYAVDRTTSQESVHLADGTLCITDQRLVFLSDTKNLDIRFDKLLSTATAPGLVQISRANAGDLLFDQVATPTIEAFEQLSGTSPDDRLAALQGGSTDDDDDDEDDDRVGYRIGYAIGKGLAVAAVVILMLIGVIAIIL